jgi:CheY-like chemotaxis protein
MLRFLGEAGVWLSDKDAIAFTAVDRGTTVTCRVRRSAVKALGIWDGSLQDLIAQFDENRALFERVIRFKWNAGRFARGSNDVPVVDVEGRDLYDFAMLRERMPSTRELALVQTWLRDGAHEAARPTDFEPLRILVVEDNLLAADAICDTLDRQGGVDVIGPAPSVELGMDLIDENKLDGAVLDINLSGAMSFPVATALATRGIPFVFLSAYDDVAVPDEFRGVRRLSKPGDLRSLGDVVTASFGPASTLRH